MKGTLKTTKGRPYLMTVSCTSDGFRMQVRLSEIEMLKVRLFLAESEAREKAENTEEGGE